MEPLYPISPLIPPDPTVPVAGATQPEATVWRAFLAINRHLFTALQYNVHVGHVPDGPPDENDDDRRLRASIYAKRVDVVARRDAETWIVELKERATPRALGQLLVYPPLVRRRFPELPRLRPVLIAATIDEDTRATCQAMGVRCIASPFLHLRE